MPETTPWYVPGGTTSNLDHDDKRPNILAGVFTTWGIAAIFVGMRLWTRARIVRALGIADLLITISLIFAAGMCAAMVYEVKHGMGRHIYDIDQYAEKHLSPMLKGFWFSLLFYILSLAFTKTSILLLYLSIFTLEWARRAVYAALAVVIIHNLWATATVFTMCIPLRGVWDVWLEDMWCQPQDAWWANTGLAIITDIIIFILPIPILGPLNLPRRQKIVVMGIFAVGFFICIVSIVRLVILVKSNINPDEDTTYNNNNLNHWTVLEVHTAIVVSCLMTLKPLAARFWPVILTPRNSRDTVTGGSAVGPNGMGGNNAGRVNGPWGVENLTIGSKPVRNFGGGREGWAEAAAAAAAANGRKKDAVDGAGEKSEGSGGSGSSSDDGGEREKGNGLGGTVVRDVEAGLEDETSSRTEKRSSSSGCGGDSSGEEARQQKGGETVVLKESGRPAISNNRLGGKGDAASVRTEQELGPEVCARSLG